MATITKTLTAFVRNADGSPALALGGALTVDVWRVSDQVQVVTAGATTEIAGGFYFHDFAAFDTTENYVIRFNAGAGFADFARYIPGANDAEDAVEITDQVWDEVLTGATHNIQNSSGKILRQLKESGGSIADGTAQAGAASSITLEAGESAVDQVFQFFVVAITAGLGAGGIRLITDYNGTTKVATVERAWNVVPDNTSEYLVASYHAAILTSDSPLNVARDAILNDATRFAGADVGSILADTAAGGAGPWTTATGFETEASAATREATNTAEHNQTQTDIGNLVDFDPAATPVELLDAGGAAGTSADELVTDIEANLAAAHGSGQWDDTASLTGLKRGRTVTINPQDTTGVTVDTKRLGNVTVSARKC